MIRDTTATHAEDLESEVQTVDNYEIGVRGTFDRISASLAGFYSESEKGTTFDAALNIVKQPERIWGVEVSVDIAAGDPWQLGGTLTCLEGEIDLDNDGNFEEDLPSMRIPPLKLTAYLEYRPLEGWSNRLQGLYSGHRDPDSTLFGSGTVSAGLRPVRFLKQPQGRAGTLILAAENLLNEDYFPVTNQAGALSFGFAKGPGRTVSVAYSIKW